MNSINKVFEKNLSIEAKPLKDSEELKPTEFINWVGIIAIFIIGLVIGGFITWFIITPRTIEKPIYMLNGSYICTEICETPYPESGYFKECYVRCNPINSTWVVYR